MTNKLIAKKIDIFASDPNASTKVLGDFSTGTGGISKDPDVLQQNTAIVIGGWLSNVLPGKAPALDHDNTLIYLITRKLKEYQQQGIPEHIDTEVYHEYSIVRKTGTYELYGCKNNNVTGTLPDNNGDEDWDFLANLNDLGGLSKNFTDDTIYYGGEFDASTQFTEVNSPVYDYADYSYTLNGINQYFTGNVQLDSDEFEFVIPFNMSSTSINPIIGQTANVTEYGIIQILDTGKLSIYLSSNTTSWDIAQDVQGTKVFAPNTDYLLRCKKTLTNYIFEYSEDDGITWVEDINIANSTNTVAIFMLGAHLYGTDRFFTGKIYLDKLYLTKDGIEIIRPQDTPYIPNSIIWKGETRSEDNSADIVSNDYIRSDVIFNANSQWNTFGDPAFINTDYSYNFDGTNKNISNPAILNTDTFEANVKLEYFSNPTGQVPILGNSSDTAERLYIFIENNKINFYASSDGTNWNIANGVIGSENFVPNTVYNFKFTKTLTEYIISYSTDNGQTWTDDVTVVDSNNLSNAADFILGANYYSLDRYLDGKVYLDGTSLILDGVEVIKPQDPATATLAYTDYYYFIGYDNTETLKLERTLNKDGSGLPTIAGAKRRLGDDKDIAFPTDGSGDLAKFTRKYNKWFFDLFIGTFTTGSVKLNSSIANYNEVLPYYSYAGDFKTSSYINVDLLLNSLGTTDSFDDRYSSASADYLFRFYISGTNKDTITTVLNQGMTLTRFIGVK